MYVPRPKKSTATAAGLRFFTATGTGDLSITEALAAGAFAIKDGGAKAAALAGEDELLALSDGGKKLVEEDAESSSSKAPVFQPESSCESIMTPGLSPELTPPPSTLVFFAG